MKIKAVVRYIDYRFKQKSEETVFRTIMAEYTATVGVGKVSQKRLSFIEERNKIYGIETPKDERTAEEIIVDTFKKHGLKIKQKEI